jgi:uncharacterized protein YkwD
MIAVGLIASLLFSLLGDTSVIRPATAATSRAATVDAAGPPVDRLESAILTAVNEVRRAHGLPALEPDPALHAVARAHSEAMGERDVLAHRDPASGSLADRVRTAGIAFRMIGENLARTRGIPDAATAVVEGWMASPGHRRNVLSPRFRKTAVGVWHEGTTYYVTQVFLEPPRLADVPR